ncbi:hypothetical protein QQ045_017707 [Rhodiola kirilowii]
MTGGYISLFFYQYGVGSRPAISTSNLTEALNLKVGKLTTGDSFNMCPTDEAAIVANNVTVKDMEGASIAYLADLLKVSVLYLKTVTDIIDGNRPTSEEFHRNLAFVIAALEKIVTRVINFINGKCLSDL